MSMFKMFSGLYDRYFSEEESIIFTMLIIAGIVIMMTLGSVIAPLIWAMVLTFILQGLVNSLRRLKIPNMVAVYLTYFIFIGLTLVTILIFIPFTISRLTRLIEELPSMVDQVQSMAMILPERYPELFTSAQVEGWITSIEGELASYGQSLLSYSVTSITRVVTWMVYIVLVPIVVFFMLKHSAKLLNWLESWLPEKRPIMAQIWHEMNDQLANYILGKAIEIIIVGTAAYIVFIILGLDYPVLLAVVIGLSVIVPYIGATVATVPVLLVAFFQWGIGSELYSVLIAYMILQIVDGNILVPVIFSETVNLHPIAIITAVLVFGGIWGFWGVFFAIPLATFLKAIINAWPDRYDPATHPSRENPVAVQEDS